jgi:hypothetical protein
MKLISHRGNINGKIPERENSPDYILEALQKGFDVEVDIWWTWKNESFGWYTGHDEPTYPIILFDFYKYFNRLWFHCKNLDALYKLTVYDFECFWHQNDDFTLTSKNHIWTFPGKPLSEHSVCVLPEQTDLLKDYSNCYGICSDYIEEYKD